MKPSELETLVEELRPDSRRINQEVITRRAVINRGSRLSEISSWDGAEVGTSGPGSGDVGRFVQSGSISAASAGVNELWVHPAPPASPPVLGSNKALHYHRAWRDRAALQSRAERSAAEEGQDGGWSGGWRGVSGGRDGDL